MTFVRASNFNIKALTHQTLTQIKQTDKVKWEKNEKGVRAAIFPHNLTWNSVIWIWVYIHFDKHFFNNYDHCQLR